MISQVEVKDPSVVVTVTVAVPTPSAVTVPSEATVSTSVSEEDQLTLVSSASAGLTVAVSTCVSPSLKELPGQLSMVTPVTDASQPVISINETFRIVKSTSEEPK